MVFSQCFYPEDKRRLEELGSKDVSFYVATTDPNRWLICVVSTKEHLGHDKWRSRLHVTVRPVWGMIRGRRATEEEMADVKQFFKEHEWIEDNGGVKDGFVRMLWEKQDG